MSNVNDPKPPPAGPANAPGTKPDKGPQPLDNVKPPQKQRKGTAAMAGAVAGAVAGAMAGAVAGAVIAVAVTGQSDDD
jgi:hypothetical protein